MLCGQHRRGHTFSLWPLWPVTRGPAVVKSQAGNGVGEMEGDPWVLRTLQNLMLGGVGQLPSGCVWGQGTGEAEGGYGPGRLPPDHCSEVAFSGTSQDLGRHSLPVGTSAPVYL